MDHLDAFGLLAARRAPWHADGQYLVGDRVRLVFPDDGIDVTVEVTDRRPRGERLELDTKPVDTQR